MPPERLLTAAVSVAQLECIRTIVDSHSADGCVSLENWVGKFEVRCHSPDWEESSFDRLKDAMKAKKVTLPHS